MSGYKNMFSAEIVFKEQQHLLNWQQLYSSCPELVSGLSLVLTALLLPQLQVVPAPIWAKLSGGALVGFKSF